MLYLHVSLSLLVHFKKILVFLCNILLRNLPLKSDVLMNLNRNPIELDFWGEHNNFLNPTGLVRNCTSV